MSAQGFYRFAATDGASEGFRPRAISYVMGAGLASAVLGPQLVRLTADALAPVPFAGAYVAAAALNVAGRLALRLPRQPAAARRRRRDGPRARSRLELLRTPRIAVAMICAMVSYALMNLVMTSTPLAIVGCGFATAAGGRRRLRPCAGDVRAVVLHRRADRPLRRRAGDRGRPRHPRRRRRRWRSRASRSAHFVVALILLGLGWNFGFIGATAMLAAAHTAEERGRVQGMNDFAVFGLVALASLASGGLMNCSGRRRRRRLDRRQPRDGAVPRRGRRPR